jgi:cystathionine beta-synthase
VLTRSDVGRGHPDYYQDLAEAIAARTPGAVYINQFANPANPKAHESTTGPEIFRQMQGNIDAVVVGVGSGGTLTGVGQFLAKHSPRSRMILADPIGSVLAPFVESGRIPKAGSWAVEGIGEDFVPPNADLKLVHKAYAISDQDSFGVRANFFGWRVSLQDPPVGPCWPRRYVTVVTRASLNVSSA